MTDDATKHLESGIALKKEGQVEAALTEFRRAVIADPKLLAAHVEIGFLCKDKARLDPVFNHHVFNAFRTAARLDPTLEVAHDQYILAAQKMGSIDDLRSEYEKLSKENPDNELMKRCYKNLVALSLAMMPVQVSVGSDKDSAGLRKFLLFGSIGLLVFGAALVFSTIFLGRRGRIASDQVKRPGAIGMFVVVAGLAGFVVRSRVK